MAGVLKPEVNRDSNGHFQKFCHFQKSTPNVAALNQFSGLNFGVIVYSSLQKDYFFYEISVCVTSCSVPSQAPCEKSLHLLSKPCLSFSPHRCQDYEFQNGNSSHRPGQDIGLRKLDGFLYFQEYLVPSDYLPVALGCCCWDTN